MKQNVNNFDVIVLIVAMAFLQPYHDVLHVPLYEPHWWQYWSGHFVHTNWNHWLLNMFVLACIPTLIPKIPRLLFWVMVFVLPVLITCLFIFAEQMQSQGIDYYYGFSGVLHGLLIFCLGYSLYDGDAQTGLTVKPKTPVCTFIDAIKALTQQRKVSHKQKMLLIQFVLFVLIITKVVHEIVVENTRQQSLTADLVGTHIMYEAHANGVAIALVALLFVYIHNKKSIK